MRVVFDVEVVANNAHHRVEHLFLGATVGVEPDASFVGWVGSRRHTPIEIGIGLAHDVEDVGTTIAFGKFRFERVAFYNEKRIVVPSCYLSSFPC